MAKFGYDKTNTPKIPVKLPLGKRVGKAAFNLKSGLTRDVLGEEIVKRL